MAVKASREKRKPNKYPNTEMEETNPLSNSNNSAAPVTIDLRNWIEQQMMIEMQSSASHSVAESARNIEVGGVVDPASHQQVAPKSSKNSKPSSMPK